MRARLIGMVLTAVLFALATWAVGWWAVPIVALVAGTREGSGGQRPRDVALAAVLGWAALLAVSAMSPAFRTLLGELGGIMTLPRAVVVAVTLIFPALLAWSAAALGGVLAGAGERPRTMDRPSGGAGAAGLPPPREEAAVRR